MRCIRTPIEADVVKYDPYASLEDGYELYAEVITKNNVDLANLVQVERGGQIVCPYIVTRRGRTFIKEGDYIVTEEDGTKLVCGGDKVFSRYTRISEELET